MTGANSFVFYLANYPINAIWLAAVVFADGWLAARLLRKFGPEAEHACWVSTLAVGVATPAATFFRPLLAFLRRQPAAGVHISFAPGPGPAGSSGFSGILRIPAPVVWAIVAIYAVVLLYFAIRFGSSLYRTRLMARNARPLILNPAQEEIWSRCQRLFALRGARILASAEVAGPVVMGLRRPVLVVPDGFAERCELPDFLTALAHECAHARRRDFQKNLFYEAVSLPLSFHPAVGAVKARIAQTREMICDRMVAEKVVDARAYAHSLLRLAAMVAAPPPTVAAHVIGIFDANILEKRVMMISLPKRRFGRATGFGLTAAALLLAGSAWIAAAASAVTVELQSPAAPADNNASPYGPLYRVGGGVSAPVPLNTVEANFPPGSRKGLKKDFHAIVLVSTIVDKDGVPRDVRTAKSYRADFDNEAVKAVQRYRFKPAKKAGEPVAVAITVEVNFKLY